MTYMLIFKNEKNGDIEHHILKKYNDIIHVINAYFEMFEGKDIFLSIKIINKVTNIEFNLFIDDMISDESDLVTMWFSRNDKDFESDTCENCTINFSSGLTFELLIDIIDRMK